MTIKKPNKLKNNMDVSFCKFDYKNQFDAY